MYDIMHPVLLEQFAEVHMFLTIKKAGSGRYVYLLESVYDPKTKKSKKKVIKNFGRYEEFIEKHPDKYSELVEKYGKSKEKFQAEKDETINSFFSAHIATTDDILKNFKGLYPQNLTHLMLRRVWKDDLLMTRFFDHLKEQEGLEFEYNASDIALYFAALKIVSPMSYLAGKERSPRFLGDPMSIYTTDDIYRCLRFLSKYKESIMKHLCSRVDKVAPREKSLLFYDCTNCYFETPYNDIYWNRKKALRILRRKLRKEIPEYKSLSDRDLNKVINESPEYNQLLEELISSLGEPLRMHGVSKEKRFDLPLISISLVIDEHAIPIDFQIYAGNQAEASTMIESIKKLRKKYNIKNAVMVADSALNGAKNLDMLLREGLGFAVAKSALTFTDKIRKNELDLSKFSRIKDEAGKETDYLYKIIPYQNVKYERTASNGTMISNKYSVDCSMMITFSENRKNRDILTLEENIKLAKTAIERKTPINLTKRGWKQFVITSDAVTANDTDNQSGTELRRTAPEQTEESKADKKVASKKTEPCIAAGLNEKIIEKRRQCAGFSAILFKAPPGSGKTMEAEYISSLYHHLVQIEECFRIMKSEFEIRPLFVRDRDSVTGHVLLCVAALIMVRIIQRRAAEKGYSITAAKLKEIMNSMTMQTLYRDDSHCVYLKSKEFNLANSLRNAEKENSPSEADPEFIFKLLTGEKMPAVATMEELRKIFKIKSMSRSEDQIRQLKCSVET
ncbi:IS1634 family transposase [Succinimonas sp.]|uniref:IS1634 family transposase n=1 Tax=Succinimonas sp. TaxID=1936151 RepID=UPI00387089A4